MLCAQRIQPSDQSNQTIFPHPGISGLWNITRGDPNICIAVLDGPVDLSHVCFQDAKVRPLSGMNQIQSLRGPSCSHGTHVASIIFGQHNGLKGGLKGIAPRCRGLIVPIFHDRNHESIAHCSQVDLARSIMLAAASGAHIINVSAGQLSDPGAAHPHLVAAVRYCADHKILIVSAAGNDGCDCLHVPGAMPSVLAVGAMNRQGIPLDFTNWGKPYRTQGVLALGSDILGAKCGGGFIRRSGTSVATPIISGVVGLLLCMQKINGQRMDPFVIRDAILSAAISCQEQPVPDCRRVLAGRLNIRKTMFLIKKGVREMSETMVVQEVAKQVMPIENSFQSVEPTSTDEVSMSACRCEQEKVNKSAQKEELSPSSSINQNGGTPSSSEYSPMPKHEKLATPMEIEGSSFLPSEVKPQDVQASGCSCGGGKAPVLVYTIGEIGFDFGTEARRDSLAQSCMHEFGEERVIDNPEVLLEYLEKHPWDSHSIIWTLNDETTPIYAIHAGGPYAQQIYDRVRQFLREQVLENSTERVSIPGVVHGSAKLLTGQSVPVIYPDIRGMFSWTTMALVESVCGHQPPPTASQEERDNYDSKSLGVRSFLDRIYHDVRNLGVTSQDRAINYAATNAFNIERVFERAHKEDMNLDSIEVDRSPICRPDSDCWDVKLIFFVPHKQFEVARKVFRFTVDVSDIVPVLVGRVREWSIR